MSEPPRKKFKQTSILDLFGRKKTNTLTPTESTEKDSGQDNSPLTQSSEVEIVDSCSSDEMSGNYEERRAKTAAAAEKRRRENASTPPKQAHSTRPSTTHPKARPQDGKQEQAGVSSANSAFSENPTNLSSQMASATLDYSPTLLADSESQNSESSYNIEEFDDSPAAQNSSQSQGGATSKLTIPSTSHNGKNKGGNSPQFDIPDNKPALTKQCFRGTTIDKLKRSPACSPKYPPQGLKTTERHAVLIKTPVTPGVVPKPSYSTYTDEWSGSYVRMPCSPENLYPVEGLNGRKDLRARWELIESALLKLIGEKTNSRELERAILIYNSRYENKWDFCDLHSFFDEHLDELESEEFFKNTLPAMVELALQLPYLCTQPIPLLKVHEEHAITFSQQQVACLLANAFFCTFPRRNAKHKHSEYSSFPTINFNELFQGSTRAGASNRKAGKLKCLINYFRRVTKEMPTGTITFYRQVEKYTDFPLWAQSESRLTNLHITANGTIEDEGEGMLQVDFANKYVGGGVLRTGCVQEEIRFMICPEMILSRLFTECLEPNECLIMTGCERFSNYDGYANSFEWTGDYKDSTPRDSWGRRYTQVVALDATAFRAKSSAQFSPDNVRRELNKAFCGFMDRQTAVSQMQAVATGNWGCGAFGGNLLLKVLIQLMAASEVKRDVCYFTFGDVDLVDSAYTMYEFLTDKDVSIATLWNLINQYYSDVCYNGASSRPKLDLFEYIYRVYRNYDDSTDEGSNSPMRLDSQQLWDNEPNIDDIVADVEKFENEHLMSSQHSGT